ncbi:MAG TPA: baseplate J/gp47 family protein [Longimicrobium sp.]|nr:baseplate J/gp47 family protein [Longimicrobium sp.]
MNGETVSLMQRPYREVVEDVLTALLGGVTNERIEYDLKADRYPLARPASAVRAVDGMLWVTGADGREQLARYSFVRETDWTFSDADNELVWLPGGRQPADETTFDVDYLPRDARSPITDVNVGSVARTVTEAVAREIAVVWEQVNQAYRSGFLETAEGRSLDLVVSILDLHRRTGEHAAGLVTFYRPPGAAGGDVVIAAGTRLGTEKGGAAFEVSEQRVLQRGQTRIDVPVRAAVRGPAGVVPAGAITTLVRPIEGIDHVTNAEPTLFGAPDETDVQLRDRARTALRALGSATTAALKAAVERERAAVVEIWDPAGPMARRSAPGEVTLLVEAEPERFAQVLDAVQTTRAAGVRATVQARYVYLRPRITAKTGGIPADAVARAQAQAVAALQGYVDALTSGGDAVGKDMLKALEAVRDLREPAFVSVAVWVSDTERADAEAVAQAVVASLGSIPPDGATLERALADALGSNAPTAPAGGRLPAPQLVVNADGVPATDAEIEKGEFRVLATVEGQKWWVVLDMSSTDVVVVEA